MKRMRWLAVSLMAMTLTAQAAGLLDGTKWKLKVTPDEATAGKGGKEFTDEVTFADGEAGFSAHVFAKSRYIARKTAETITWKTTQESDKDGQMYWMGEVKGDTITGELEWTKPDESVLHYTFTGTKE